MKRVILKVDMYTKIVLTAIAFLLLISILQSPNHILTAQSSQQPLEVNIAEVGGLPVSNVGGIPVEISNVFLTTMEPASYEEKSQTIKLATERMKEKGNEQKYLAEAKLISMQGLADTTTARLLTELYQKYYGEKR